jgi:glycosyltransferase involved in cell wall biosynthesis
VPEVKSDLVGARVLCALNGLELFGHELGNIEVFKALRELGAEVLVGVNARPDNMVATELGRLGFATIPLPFGPQWSIQFVRKEPWIAFTNIWALFRCSRIFLGLMREFCPTHIHLGSPLTYSYLSLALAFNKTPLVYRVGDCPPTDSPFNLSIWKAAMRRSSNIVCISEFVRAAATAVDVKNCSVIHNFAPERDEIAIKPESFGVRQDSRSLIYVGSVAEHKGLVPLVDALALVSPNYSGLSLDIVGGSRYDYQFRERLTEVISGFGIADRVVLQGYEADPTRYYKNADIHVAPSIWEEALGNVVLEAKREGTPSLVFPSGGLPEMVRHKVDGYICEDKTAESLAEGLRWMLADPVRLRRMGDAAREDFHTRFGRARFLRAWADVYGAAL